MARRKAEQRTALSAATDCYLFNTTVVGGFGSFGTEEIHIGDVVSVAFSAEEMRLRIEEHEEQLVLGLPFTSVHAIEIGGPGAVTTSTGVIGGGFGIEGALQGMAIATVLNALTTQTTVNTIVHIDTDHGELFLHTSQIEPGALRLALSPAMWRLANRARHSQIPMGDARSF
jgi:hypothetical protein